MTFGEDLKHFHYHWFWGLQYYLTPQPLSLWTQISSWPTNEITFSRKNRRK